MPNDTPSTLILRFRDLSTPEGDTLRLHAQGIGDKGYVWWGWWAKSGERVPQEVFGELLAKAESDEGLEFFLFDSGRESLHRAVCRSIRWHPGGRAEPSPEPGATPGYYQGRPCPAWFRISEIAEAPEENPAAVLQRWSYVRVDDLFESRQAAELVRYLRSWAKLERYQLSVCPGNHDVAYSARPWEAWAPVERAEDEARAAYADFYTEEFYLPPNEFLSCGRKYLLGGAIPVEVVSLNSSLLGQKDGLFQGHGFVGDAQLDDAAAQMGWKAEATGPVPLRIVVVHHHLLPVAYREAPVAGRPYSVVLDAEALTRWVIRHRVKVVLHGHMHAPFYAALERPLHFGEARSHRVHVFGMGSSGVKPDHLGEERRNVFGVLTFSRDELTVAYHSVDPVHPSQEVGRHTIRIWDD